MNEPLLLLLETATAVCSVVLSRGERILAVRTASGEREHASVLAVYIREVIMEAEVRIRDIDGVVVSRGPGSYTGLRIGVATAKGICYALNKPLLAIDTPMAMASCYLAGGVLPYNPCTLVPVIDARRMEVYGAAMDAGLNYLQPIRAEILSPSSFITHPDRYHIIFGDAAMKCTGMYQDQPLVKVDISFRLTAEGLLRPGLRAFCEGRFENPAYFEPFYLKEFIAKTRGG